MKQKKLDDILYVFTDEAYEITEDTDASIVYVQAHSKEAFEALNPDLTFKKINYNVLTVNNPVWREYLVAPDEEEQEPSIDPTPTPPAFEPVTYSFVSYDPTGETQYGVGKVQTTGDEENNRIKVQVTENDVEGFVGNYYWVDSSAEADNGILYVLYATSTDDGTSVGISVKIYTEDNIPSNADPVDPDPQEETKPTADISWPSDSISIELADYTATAYENGGGGQPQALSGTNASDSEIIYSSGNELIVSVDSQTGNVTAYSEGTVTMFAYHPGNASVSELLVSYTLTVTDSSYTPPSDGEETPEDTRLPADISWPSDSISIELADYNTNAYENGGGGQPQALQGANGSDAGVYYTSSDQQVAYVDDYTGNITAYGEGETTITAYHPGNEYVTAVTVSYTLTVTDSSYTPPSDGEETPDPHQPPYPPIEGE